MYVIKEFWIVISERFTFWPMIKQVGVYKAWIIAKPILEYKLKFPLVNSMHNITIIVADLVLFCDTFDYANF